MGDEFVAALNHSNVLECIDIEIRDSIAEITMNTPPHNYFTMRLLEEIFLLGKMFMLAREANKFAIRGIIIAGTGRSFSPGVSIDMLNELTEKKDQERAARILREVLAMIENSKVPVIAAINGICLGAGFEVALACHYRVCSKRVHLGFPEINLDLMPGASGTQTLPKLIGRSKAQYLLLSGKLTTAEDALRIGMVDVVVDRDRVMDVARGIARDTCFRNEKTTEYMLKAITAALNSPAEEGRMLEERFFWELVNDRLSRNGFASNEVELMKRGSKEEGKEKN